MTIKDRVLKTLLKNQGEFYSGQDLANSLEVSRTSIWKAIESLRKEGVQIEATTRKGYRILPNEDKLEIDIIQNNLLSELVHKPFYLYESIDSTNTEAARQDDKKELPSFSIFLAEEQTQGRGRTGKNFHSPYGSGIYLSLILKEDISLELITIKAAVSLCLAIEKTTSQRPKIKWVNDLYLDGKKISGILSEGKILNGTLNRVIVGIGLNVTTMTEDFGEELEDIAGSLFPKNITRNELTAEIINAFYNVTNNWTKDQVLEAYKARCFVLGEEISFSINDIAYRGIAKDINSKGNLLVEVGEQILTLSSGEISILGPWNK